MLIYVVVIILLVAAVAIVSWVSYRRGQEINWLAIELELDYDPGKDTSGERYFRETREVASMLDSRTSTGKSLSGRYRGHRVVVVDIHTSSSSFAMFQLDLPKRLPVLSISPVRTKLKWRRRLLFRDISFESSEFFRKFRVEANDKKFAYDVCHPRMIEYLLAHPRLMVAINGSKLALYTSRRWVPKTVKPNLDHLVEVRELLPEYLFSRS